MTDRPLADQAPLIAVSGYTRTMGVRSVTFLCQGCGRTMTEERRPGPLPRYCQTCSSDPVLIRERAQETRFAPLVTDKLRTHVHGTGGFISAFIATDIDAQRRVGTILLIV